MSFAIPLLALPFLLGAVFALCWVNRRLPPGWKGVALGFAALGGISLLTIGGWVLAIQSVTWGNYVCTDCGRAEKRTQFGPLVLSRSLNSDGEEYAKRFAASLPAGHAHDWHLESCLYSFGRVGCTMQCVGGWFTTLPRLADRKAADDLFREAQALPYEERCRLMDEFTAMVWHDWGETGGVDRAFELWRAKRGK